MPRSQKLVLVLALAAVAFNSVGNYFLSVGMRSIGATISVSPLAYLRVLTNGWVALGVVLLACWLISQLSLLSWADLTYVLPITSLAYVLTALLGAFFLHEHVSPTRWAGVALIFLGVAIVGRTRPRTAPGTSL
jgi:drug/metabolite transporter (DMT)-like permease